LRPPLPCGTDAELECKLPAAPRLVVAGLEIERSGRELQLQELALTLTVVRDMVEVTFFRQARASALRRTSMAPIAGLLFLGLVLMAYVVYDGQKDEGWTWARINDIVFRETATHGGSFRGARWGWEKEW
jgi:uncharacterized membrane protein